MNVGKRHLVATLVAIAWGCDQAGDTDGFIQIDTLETGQVVVVNGSRGAWPPGNEWRVVEQLRIGALHSEGPFTFGRINSIAADGLGRVWVLEGQASELRVFGPDGVHLRTIGRSGEGPGEFTQPARVDISPDGEIWVMDPLNGRISAFNTLGVLLGTRPFGGGFVTVPWRGGFDNQGRYRSPIVRFEPSFQIRIALLDDSLTVIDSIVPPEDPRERNVWRIEADGQTRVMAGVPFQGRLVWRLSNASTVWALLTDEYRLFELTAEGDTLRSMTKPFAAVPVTSEQLDSAVEQLTWFTDQGGKVDRSMIPREKPSVSWFFLDDDNNVWVSRVNGSTTESSDFDVFDADARFLGTVAVPFVLQEVPIPFVRDGLLYGVTRCEFDEPYVVRAEVVRPSTR